MIEIGRLCIKTCGRDAGGTCIIVDILDKNYVLIDGNVRRRKCNIFHLEPTPQKIEIKKGASHEEVKKEFEKLKLDVWKRKKKEKTKRPRKIRRKKKKPIDEEKPKEKKEKKKSIDTKIVSIKKEEKVEEKKPLKKEKKKNDKRGGKK